MQNEKGVSTILLHLFITHLFMLTKRQLESMSMDELHALATNIGAEQNEDQTTLIYNIIDKESEVGSTDVQEKPLPK